MITKELIERIYSAATIQRWNDHVRPVELTELDKQAHKMIIAYVIGKFEEEKRGGGSLDWLKLIEGGIFEFLQRIMLTDIKPAIFHEMMSKKGNELNHWVAEKLKGELRGIPGDFQERFERYLFDDSYAVLEKRLLRASHYLATRWEFSIIYNLNSMIYGIEKTKEEIEGQIEQYYDLAGVQKIVLCKQYYGFLDLCGQLRFQQRWAQSPRIPKTSVLGHMLIVAIFSYLCSLEIKACARRSSNDFYASLFHDLPEVMTRDIVSPIKTSVEGLEDIIKLYETKQIEEKILPLLPPEWHAEMRYFVENEFSNKVRVNGETVLTGDTIDGKYNRDEYSPVDGRLIRVCDKLAAFIEAALSLSYGIKSDHLVQGKNDTYAAYKDTAIEGFSFRRLFDYFLNV